MVNTIDGTEPRMKIAVRGTVSARNLSLFRSLAIFLFQQQRQHKAGRKSLPDFQSRNHSHPWALIRWFTEQKET